MFVHVKPDRKGVVRGRLPFYQEITPGNGLYACALVQDEPCVGLAWNPDFEVDPENSRLSQPRQVEIESGKLRCAVDLVLQLLAQFAPERVEWSLACVHGTAEATPVVRVENIGQDVAKLHHVSAVIKDKQCRDSIGCLERTVPPDEVIPLLVCTRRISSLGTMHHRALVAGLSPAKRNPSASPSPDQYICGPSRPSLAGPPSNRSAVPSQHLALLRASRASSASPARGDRGPSHTAFRRAFRGLRRTAPLPAGCSSARQVRRCRSCRAAPSPLRGGSRARGHAHGYRISRPCRLPGAAAWCPSSRRR